ncbi:hypothetical protein F503_07539 [Ophiostoma piceae UAMH 11346]|uniref:HNH nuclease domain-containing protein n=1 Tax=Ophiostoma piceae (strain UAMH 11346) TaxID=1262450 RepID=S3CSY8_OPHP1|nr:hypothetical protein F503_07539 [Ophiostoma piceae UAMH 11346]
MADQPPSWETAAQASTPHHRHQASLEQVVDMSSTAQESLSLAERAAARDTFYRVVQHFESADPYITEPRATRRTLYSQPRLVRYTYEFARSVESQDIVLRSFFDSLALDLAANEANLDFTELAPLFSAYADYLMDNFFLPLKASTSQTPQPSPAIHSAVLRAQGATDSQAYIGTEERLSTLRAECLVRDRHRCVISREFSNAEFGKRLELYGNEARDDDGILFSDLDNIKLDILEVAHILPHSLMKASTGSEMNASRQAALSILNMFDRGVVDLINGIDIDRPRNALTLTPLMHGLFGAFKIYLEAVDGQYNTYRIKSFLEAPHSRVFNLPITRTLYVTENRTIDPPSPRFLAVHCAIAHILHLSGAGDYIDYILRDMEEHPVRADGTSALGRLVSLGLGGWMDGAVYS